MRFFSSLDPREVAHVLGGDVCGRDILVSGVRSPACKPDAASGDTRVHVQPAGEVMAVMKAKTELAQRCPPPPCTRWDQRVKPVLLSYLMLNDGKSLCLSLQTPDPDIAKRHMRLLVAWLLAKGRLSPDSGAAKVYGPKRTERSRLKKVFAEFRRLKALSETGYGSQARP